MGGANRNRLNESFFGSIKTERQAYWLGFLSADGCVSWNRSTVAVALSRRDRDHLVKLAHHIEFEGRVIDYAQTHTGRECSTIYFGSAQLRADLIAKGVTPRKTMTLKPWDGPDHLLAPYWRGFVDGDGWWFIERGRYPTVGLVGTLAVVEAFSAFVATHTGFTPSFFPHHSTGGIWNAVIHNNGPATQAVAKLLYTDATVCLDRKYQTVQAIQAMNWKRLKSHKHVTAESLIHELIRQRNWSGVGNSLGIDSGHLSRLRQRFGLSNLWKGGPQRQGRPRKERHVPT